MTKKTDKAERKFAEIITDAHRKSGLSNKEFAALCGTSTVQLWRWENGSSGPSMELANKVLKALGLTMTLGRAERKKYER